MESNRSDTDHEGLEKLHKAKAKARKVGLHAALNHHPEVAHSIQMDIPNTFGDRWAYDFRRRRQRLSENYKEEFASLLRVSAREYIYACHKAAAFMLEVVAPDDARHEATLRLTTPKGYADSEGWAYTLFDSLSSLYRPTELLQGTSFETPVSSQDVLNSMAILWFFDAASAHENDGCAMNLLFEAANALTLSNGIFMWECSKEHQEEELKEMGSKRARSLNEARHRKTNEARARVIQDWAKDPARFPSAEKAGLHYTYWLARNDAVYEPRTVTGWIRSHAKRIGVRFR